MKQILFKLVAFYCLFSVIVSTSIRKNKQWGGPSQAGYQQAGGYNQGGYNQGGFNQGGSNQGGFNQGGYHQGGYNQGGNQPNYQYHQSPPGLRPLSCHSVIDCNDCGANIRQCHQGTCFCCQGKTCYCQK